MIPALIAIAAGGVLLSGCGDDDKEPKSIRPLDKTPKDQRGTIDSVSKLVEKGKLEASWQSVKVAQSKQKKFGGNLEWVISFTNENISDSSKQTLYIFLSLGGEYIAANYTGE